MGKTKEEIIALQDAKVVTDILDQYAEPTKPTKPKPMDLKELLEEMPYKWRVQSAKQWGATCVAYVDARDVQKKLDEVCGPDRWQVKYDEHKGNLFASIGILTASGWVWKSDCGTESNVEKQKGEASDAFKRAAVMWGVGRFLYDKSIPKLPTKEKEGKFVPYSKSKGRFITKPADITAWCESLIK